MPQTINASEVAESRVPISHAVRTGNLLYVSGITPFAPDGGIAKKDFPAQMRQCMDNIAAILAEAGSSFDRVVKMNVLLGDVRADFSAMNEIYRSYFEEGRYPARTTVGVTLPHPDFLLEIECVAEV